MLEEKLSGREMASEWPHSQSSKIENDLQTIIKLLSQNNEYLKQLSELEKKEHREMIAGKVFHFFTSVIPWIVVLILGYFVWQSLMHYLEALNNNINTMKGNFDTLFDFFKKLIPDFGSIGSKIKTTWENAQFWK